LPVSAKPVAMFSKVENITTYATKDLLRLSKVLLPFHLILLMVFTLWVWPVLGLSLTNKPLVPTQAPVINGEALIVSEGFRFLQPAVRVESQVRTTLWVAYVTALKAQTANGDTAKSEMEQSALSLPAEQAYYGTFEEVGRLMQVYLYYQVIQPDNTPK
jgi:hypothetical protein